MKNILVFMLLAAAAMIAPVVSYAVSPELKELQTEINSNCPMDIGGGIIFKKINFPNDKYFEVHLSSEIFRDFNSTSFDAKDIKRFHKSFLKDLTPENVVVLISEDYNLDAEIVMYNPAGEKMFSVTFTQAELTRSSSRKP